MMSLITKTIVLCFAALSIVMAADAFNGQGTFYDPSVGLTACGTLHKSAELIAALNAPQFDPKTPNHNPNKNSLCNKHVLVKGPKGSVTVKIVDRCPACKHGDLDLSPAVFSKINGGSLTAGRIPISWNWV